MTDEKERQRRLQEYFKCKTSFEYFCRKYIKLELPGGDRLMTPYQKQIELINLIHSIHNMLVLKSRQIGISTVIQAYAAWLVCFFKNAVIGIISKDGKEATDFARSIMSMIDKLPIWLSPKYKKRTEQQFILDNGCKCYATPVNPNHPERTLRGKAITFLVIDEAAFVPHIEDAWVGMVPALSTNQKHAREASVPYGTLILSTPNKTTGLGAWFYKRYQRSMTGDDIFKHMVIHWKQIHELANDPLWYRTQCEMFGNDPRAIKQELDLVFLPTKGSFLDEITCEKLQRDKPEPIEIVRIFSGESWMFKKPEKGKYYLIGVDTAAEHGEDNSAITVWDYVTLEQVWEYEGKLSVTDFGKVVRLACTKYPGLLVVENTGGYGNQVCEEINRSDLSNMLYKEKKTDNKIVPGLSNNSKTRPLIIDSLYSYITEFPELVRSKRLALELVGLITKPTGKVEGDVGCRDDLALATACCFYVRKYDPPMAIESNKFLSDTMFIDVMKMNDNQRSNITNEDIMQTVKDNMYSNQGFVNTLSFYDGTSQLNRAAPGYKIESRKGIDLLPKDEKEEEELGKFIGIEKG
jgi:hypothetical protein